LASQPSGGFFDPPQARANVLKLLVCHGHSPD
jgi:hypothetical protein